MVRIGELSTSITRVRLYASFQSFDQIYLLVLTVVIAVAGDEEKSYLGPISISLEMTKVVSIAVEPKTWSRRNPDTLYFVTMFRCTAWG